MKDINVTERSLTADAAGADVLLVNTCAFIESSKEESVDAILDLADVKAEPSTWSLAGGAAEMEWRVEHTTRFFLDSAGNPGSQHDAKASNGITGFRCVR